MGICRIIRGDSARLTRENDRLKAELAEERERRAELEDAVLELGNLYADQDDAIVELAELIIEEE